VISSGRASDRARPHVLLDWRRLCAVSRPEMGEPAGRRRV